MIRGLFKKLQKLNRISPVHRDGVRRWLIGESCVFPYFKPFTRKVCSKSFANSTKSNTHIKRHSLVMFYYKTFAFIRPLKHILEFIMVTDHSLSKFVVNRFLGYLTWIGIQVKKHSHLCGKSISYRKNFERHIFVHSRENITTTKHFFLEGKGSGKKNIGRYAEIYKNEKKRL